METSHVKIGSIGHADHGKTTLLAAITHFLSKQGKATSTGYNQIHNATAQQDKGVSLRLASIDYKTDTRPYLHFDCPTHQDYIKAMVSGKLPMNAAILVVSATEGITPQTQEQVALANQVGVSKVVVYLNKCDQINDQERLELIENAIENLLNSYDLPSAPVIRGSALKALHYEDDSQGYGVGSIRSLMKALDGMPAAASVAASPRSRQSFKAAIYALKPEEGGRKSAFMSGYQPEIHFPANKTTSELSNFYDSTHKTPLELVMPGSTLYCNVALINASTVAKGTSFTLVDGGSTVGVGIVLD